MDVRRVRSQQRASDVLADLVIPDAPVGDLALRIRGEVDPRQLHAALDRKRERLSTTAPAIDDQAIENLKFSAAVPLKLARETVSERLADADGVLQTVDAPITAAHGPASASAAAD